MTQTIPDKKPVSSPFCLRLTDIERERLERDAAGLSLGAYIRSRIFDDQACPRRTRGKFPVKDHQMLSQVLGELGRSRIPNNLNQIAKAIHTGSFELTPEISAIILEASADIREIRKMIMAALGLER